jgi:hypothetical protein
LRLIAIWRDAEPADERARHHQPVLAGDGQDDTRTAPGAATRPAPLRIAFPAAHRTQAGSHEN